MVPFNVVPNEAGQYHRASSGQVMIAAGPEAVADMLKVAGLDVAETPDVTAVQWGKLLINLNNAVNALSGLPLQQQLVNRRWRCLMADQMAEALRVLKAVGIRTKSMTLVPSGLIPWILRPPTPVFRKLAAQMLTVDPSARL